MKSSVVDIIKDNLITRGKEKKEGINSNIRTCLVVQGGGMRASYSMGCLHALEDLGFSESFDCVVGSSAGAINGAYFLAKQAELATRVYSDMITNLKFINPLRFWRILDVSYLVNIFSKGAGTLDTEKVINSKTDLYFSLVNYPSGKECFISARQHPEELMNLIKASAALPVISNEKVSVAEEKYLDGMVASPVPLKFAIDSGFTDIVLILTQPKSFKLKIYKFIFKLLSPIYFADWPKDTRKSLFERFQKTNEVYDYVWSQSGDQERYRVLIVSPDDRLSGKRLSINKNRVLSNIEQGYQDVFKKLG